MQLTRISSLYILCMHLISSDVSGFIVHSNDLLSRRTMDVSLLSEKSDKKYESYTSNPINISSSRRSLLSTVTASIFVASLMPELSLADAGVSAKAITTPAFSKDLYWPVGKIAFSLLPLAGTSTRRATVEEEVVPNTIWTHDQIQGIVNVNVPVRQTVVRLSEKAGGGLLVYNPVAPTPQLLKMMKILEANHGKVRHIILGTVALEHKATFGA